MNLFEKLRTRDVEVSSLLARVFISADEEVRAVALLHESIQQLPMDHNLLDVQATFCLSKGRGDLALECAKRSVIAAPGEFGPWAGLADIYVSLEEWELALLTLNSCPMFTHHDKDAPRMPDPTSRVMLPVSPENLLDEINEDEAVHFEHVHPTVRKLVAFSYKGTFAKAYSLLSEITARIGWDQLLRIRSKVFVMEEEYRNETRNRRSSSTTAMKGTSNPSVNGVVTESPEAARQEPIANGDHTESFSPPTETTAVGTEDGEIEKPEHTVTSEEVKGGSDDVSVLTENMSIASVLVTAISTKHRAHISPIFKISDCVNAGWIISSWYCMKISGCIPSGVRRWLNTRKRVYSIRNRRKNGSYWARLQSDYTIQTRPSKHMGTVWSYDSVPER